MTTETQWVADPERGAEFVKPRRDEILEKMRNAADVGVFAVNLHEQEAITRIKAEAGQKRAKIQKAVTEMTAMEPMRLVRKFWNTDASTAWQHFLGDQAKVGDITE